MSPSLLTRVLEWLVPRHDQTLTLACPNAVAQYEVQYSTFVDVEIDTDGMVGTWTYECPLCGAHHRYCWGPPIPAYVGDADAD